jgi:hypothetical protein
MRIEVQEAKANLTAETKSLKKRAFIKKVTKETIGNEAAQAVIRIFETEHNVLKVFWLVCLLGSCSLCGYLVSQTFLTYLSYPVYTTTTIVQEVPTVFPKVTICNSAFAVTKYAFQIIKLINEEIAPGISIFNQTQMNNLSFDDMQSLNLIFWAYLMRINLNSFSDVSRQKLTHSIEDVLWYCQFNGRPCSANDFVWRWDPIYGNCYSFNSGFNSSGQRISAKKSFSPGAVIGLQLNVYVGYYDELDAFNTGFFFTLRHTSVLLRSKCSH